jgi:PAS domain S-box-containing protein
MLNGLPSWLRKAEDSGRIDDRLEVVGPGAGQIAGSDEAGLTAAGSYTPGALLGHCQRRSRGIHLGSMTPSVPVTPVGLPTAASGRAVPSGLASVSTIAAVSSVMIGAIVLVGWWLGIDALKSIVPGLLTMKVNTAIAFVLLGAGILLRARGRRVAVVPLLAVIVLAAVVGSQYLLGRDLGIDQWLFRELPGQLGTVYPNRMAPMTVVCFLLLGTGVLLVGRRGAEWIASAFFIAVLLIASLSVLDATFGPPTPTLLARDTQMALVAAATMIIASFGALDLVPGGGPFAPFAGESASAKLARRLFAASALVPVLLMWLWFTGEDRGFYGPEYGASLVVIGTVVVLTAVIHYSARAMQRSEGARERALEERDRFFDVSIDMLATANAEGYFIRLNPAWTKTLGYELAELRACPFIDFVHPDDRDATIAEAARQINQGETVLNFHNRYRHRDGSYRWLEWTSTPSADGTRLYAMARDITARKAEDERLAAILAPAHEALRRRAEAYSRIEAMIARRAFRPVFQPIVELATGRIVGFEALTRFEDQSRPDEVFALALDCGLSSELEKVTLEAALEGARRLPSGAWLSLNVSPPFVVDGALLPAVLGAGRRPVVLEITEHEAIAEYAPLREAVRRLGPDVRLAVDDAGAGVANFNHLVELRPDFVKIDIGLVHGVDADPSRRAVVVGLIHFAAETGCQVIAEGIETPAEQATVTELGVTLGQGYLLAQPAPASTWSVAGARLSSIGTKAGPGSLGRGPAAASTAQPNDQGRRVDRGDRGVQTPLVVGSKRAPRNAS